MGPFVFERTLPGTNEVFGPDGVPRPVYDAVFEELEKTGPERWVENLRRAYGLLLNEQYAFGIREGDKTHPTDWFPRVVPAADWERLSKGVAQRMQAVNEFLRRLESGTQEVVPEEVIETSILYDPTLPNQYRVCTFPCVRRSCWVRRRTRRAPFLRRTSYTFCYSSIKMEYLRSLLR